MSQPTNDDFSQHLSDDEASYHEDASDNGTATNKPKQQQQQLTPTTTTISNIKLPILKRMNMIYGPCEMEHYLEYIDKDKIMQFEKERKERPSYLCHSQGTSDKNSCGMYECKRKLGSQKVIGLVLEAHGAEVSTEDANHKFLRPANDDFSQHLSNDEASYHEDTSDSDLERSRKMSQPANDDFSQHLSNDEASYHEDTSDSEYDIWAIEMEHYLEYIDNDVWKVIMNGNSKKRISTRKGGVVRVLPPVSAVEIHVVEKERKARTILLMAIPKVHLRRFHGINNAKEIWEAIRTRFGGNANSKKMQKAIFKQQFEAFTILSSEGLEKGYDRFQQLLSQLEAHGAEVSTEDANHKFLRSLPPSWSNLAMTMRTKPDVDTLSIDDLYNNLRVFEQELTTTSKSSTSAQNVAFVSHCKSITNKVKSGHTSAYNTYTPSPSSNNIQEREVPTEQIDDVDIEEMDINWQIAMIAIRMKKFYKKTGRRVQIDGNKPVGFDKKKLECFKCHNTGHFARECPSKGINDEKKRDSFYQDQRAGKKEQNQNCLLTMDDGVVNWGEHTVEEEETNHAVMAIS
ncbi:ribonuclease H-like domain-containing protein [Tanacetum coccineum]